MDYLEAITCEDETTKPFKVSIWIEDFLASSSTIKGDKPDILVSLSSFRVILEQGCLLENIYSNYR